MFWTNEVSLPHFNRYRVRFGGWWSGNTSQLSITKLAADVADNNYKSEKLINQDNC